MQALYPVLQSHQWQPPAKHLFRQTFHIAGIIIFLLRSRQMNAFRHRAESAPESGPGIQQQDFIVRARVMPLHATGEIFLAPFTDALPIRAKSAGCACATPVTGSETTVLTAVPSDAGGASVAHPVIKFGKARTQLQQTARKRILMAKMPESRIETALSLLHNPSLCLPHYFMNFFIVLSKASLPGWFLRAVRQIFSASSFVPCTHSTSPRWAAISGSGLSTNACCR